MEATEEGAAMANAIVSRYPIAVLDSRSVPAEDRQGGEMYHAKVVLAIRGEAGEDPAAGEGVVDAVDVVMFWGQVALLWSDGTVDLFWPDVEAR